MSLLIASTLVLAAAQATSGSIEGHWINPAKSVIIAIGPCGEAQCGVVTWASAEAQADARKGTPQLIGTALLTDLKSKGTDKWQGKLFVPDQKLHVEAKLERLSNSQIKVAGCAVGGLICDSQTWSLSTKTP